MSVEWIYLLDMFMLHMYVTGVPDCNEEDLSVARALNLSWASVLKTHEDGTQTLINSEEVSTNTNHSLIKSKQHYFHSFVPLLLSVV